MTTTIDRAHTTLHPVIRSKIDALQTALTNGFAKGETKSNFRVFETYRSPQRQRHLFLKTTSTKAPEWTSAHQYGMAADFAVWDETAKKWSWPDDADWKYLAAEARKVGLATPLAWDKGHVSPKDWRGSLRAYLSA